MTPTCNLVQLGDREKTRLRLQLAFRHVIKSASREYCIAATVGQRQGELKDIKKHFKAVNLTLNICWFVTSCSEIKTELFEPCFRHHDMSLADRLHSGQNPRTGDARAILCAIDALALLPMMGRLGSYRTRSLHRCSHVETGRPVELE